MYYRNTLINILLWFWAVKLIKVYNVTYQVVFSLVSFIGNYPSSEFCFCSVSECNTVDRHNYANLPQNLSVDVFLSLKITSDKHI